MRRNQRQSLKGSIRQLYYTLVGLLPVIEMVLYLVVGVLFVWAVMAGVVYMLTLVQQSVVSVVGQVVQVLHHEFAALLDGFVAIIDKLPTPGELASFGWGSTESPPIDDPERWDESESVWRPLWEQFRVMILYLLFMAVWAVFLFQQIVDIDSSDESERFEPMDLEELEEHYKERYMNGEITKDELETRIDIVHQSKQVEENE